MKRLFCIVSFIMLTMLAPVTTSATPLQEMKDLIEDQYYGDLQSGWQQATTIESLVDYLDTYSTYMTQEQYRHFYNSVDSQSVGIGIVIEKHDKGLLITQIIEGTNAAKAGIVAGDIITAVNGTTIANNTLEEASALIRGEAGTTVKMTILKSTGTTVNYTIARQQFSVPNTTARMLANNIGYISLNTFSQNAATLIRNDYIKLANNGAKSIIIDLQYNSGGYVQAAENVIGLFQNAPHAYIEKKATGERKVLATAQATQLPKNTRVLINSYSASASEMVAAALKDQQAATLYGQRTYGKGVMQAAYTLFDGSYFKLTVAEFLGPNRTKIQNIGITPHITTDGEPLYRAHLDAIVEQLDEYKQLESLNNVASDKTFTMTFNNAVQANVAASALQLIELGSATTIPLSLQVDGTKLFIDPQQNLKSNQQYALIVQPIIASIDKQSLSRGYYTLITVR